MILTELILAREVPCLPRTSGDDPNDLNRDEIIRGFAPHKRG